MKTRVLISARVALNALNNGSYDVVRTIRGEATVGGDNLFSDVQDEIGAPQVVAALRAMADLIEQRLNRPIRRPVHMEIDTQTGWVSQDVLEPVGNDNIDVTKIDGLWLVQRLEGMIGWADRNMFAGNARGYKQAVKEMLNLVERMAPGVEELNRQTKSTDDITVRVGKRTYKAEWIDDGVYEIIFTIPEVTERFVARLDAAGFVDDNNVAERTEMSYKTMREQIRVAVKNHLIATGANAVFRNTESEKVADKVVKRLKKKLA